MDLTRDRSDTCPVHEAKMSVEIVPVVYGLPHESEFEEMKEAGNRFPFGRDYVLGGCIRGGYKWARVFRCATCRRARADWLKEKGFTDINKP
jgi:hypothetical protein